MNQSNKQQWQQKIRQDQKQSQEQALPFGFEGPPPEYRKYANGDAVTGQDGVNIDTEIHHLAVQYIRLQATADKYDPVAREALSVLRRAIFEEEARINQDWADEVGLSIKQNGKIYVNKLSPKAGHLAVAMEVYMEERAQKLHLPYRIPLIGKEHLPKWMEGPDLC